LVDNIEVVLGVPLWDSLQRGILVVVKRPSELASTHAEVLNLAEDLVVQSKVVARDDVDTGIFLDLPVGKTQSLGFGEKVGL
jgi:hypothetical protein